MICYDPHNSITTNVAIVEPTKVPSPQVSGGGLWKRVKRAWCRLLHNAFRTPIRGIAICDECLEEWDTGL